MEKLIGELKQVNKIEGFLTPIYSIILNGKLTPTDNRLVGELTSLQLNKLVGTLKNNTVHFNVILTIPPEVPTENYTGNYVVIPKPFDEQTLKTAGLKMKNNVVVKEIPYYETGNESGYTVYIGGE